MTYDLKPDPEPLGEKPGGFGPDDSRHTVERVVGAEVRCVNCGYQLRGLTRRHRCPECGTPIAVSLAGNELQHASPRWLRQLRRGVLLVLWSLGPSVLQFWLQGTLGTVLQITSAGLWCAGVWSLSAEAPGTPFSGSAVRLGLAARVVAVISLGCALLSLPGWPLYWVFRIASGLAWMTLLIVVSFLLRGVAARTPDVALEQSTLQAGWGLVLGLALMLLGLFVANFVFISIAALGTLASTACALWLMVLLMRYYDTISWSLYEALRQGDSAAVGEHET